MTDGAANDRVKGIILPVWDMAMTGSAAWQAIRRKGTCFASLVVDQQEVFRFAKVIRHAQIFTQDIAYGKTDFHD